MDEAVYQFPLFALEFLLFSALTSSLTDKKRTRRRRCTMPWMAMAS